MPDETRLTIGALAAAAGVGVETIRFYQRKGLLRTPPRSYGQVRRYGAVDTARLTFVKSAQRLGFSLDDVAELLRLDRGTQCSQARTIAERRLDDVRSRLRMLSRMEAVLDQLVADCGARDGPVTCPLIEALHEV
jgi:MerR family mercuric resistance operon transcriptional regulator